MEKETGKSFSVVDLASAFGNLALRRIDDLRVALESSMGFQPMSHRQDADATYNL